MTEERDEKGRGEKDHDEKGRPAERERRHDEKGKQDEKGEKFSRDPLQAVFIGLIIIWVAALWFLRSNSIIVSGEWWQWFIVGLGAIFIIDRLIRYASPAHRRPMLGRILVGVVLIGVGLSFIYGIGTWWPIIVGVVGVAFIVYGIRRASKPKS